MSYHPPVAWTAAATEQDPEVRGHDANLYRGVGDLKTEMAVQMRTLTFSMIGLVGVVVGVVLIAERLG